MKHASIVIYLLLGGTALAATSPQEYAAGWRIAPENPGAFYEIALPYDVLAASQHDLRDIGIFNANGEPVAWWLHPHDESDIAERRVPLTVYADEQTAARASGTVIELQQSAAQTTLRVTPAPEAAVAAATAAFVIAVPEDSPALHALELSWPDQPRSFVGRVEVAASDDLAHWRSAGAGAIAELHAGPNRHVQNRVLLSGNAARWLRITWQDTPDGWALSEAVGIHRSRPVTPSEWHAFAPVAGKEGLTVGLGAALRPHALRLELAPDNAVVAVRVEARAGPEAAWRLLHQGVFFQSREDGELRQSPPVALSARTLRELRIQVIGGRESDIQRVSLAWNPPRLIFVATEPAPYLLAAGRMNPVRASDQARIQQAPWAADDDKAPASVEAAVGERIELSGAAALERAWLSDWKNLLLWTLLVAGAAIVLAMAWRLLRTPRH